MTLAEAGAHPEPISREAERQAREEHGDPSPSLALPRAVVSRVRSTHLALPNVTPRLMTGIATWAGTQPITITALDTASLCRADCTVPVR